MERRLRFLEGQLALLTNEDPESFAKIKYDELTHEQSNTAQMEELEVHSRHLTKSNRVFFAVST